MSSDLIEQLKQVCTSGELEELEILQTATKTCLEAWKSGKRPTDRRHWREAKSELGILVAELEKKYMSPPPALNSVMDLLRFCEDQGRKISKSQLYRDRDKGAFRVEADGKILESEARAYASNLQKVESDNADMAGLHGEKLQVEIDRLKAQAEKAKFDLEKERSRYLPKSEVRAELAAKLAAIEGGIKHLMITKAADYIHMTGGDPKKAHLLVDVFNVDFDSFYNELLDFPEIEITLEWAK